MTLGVTASYIKPLTHSKSDTGVGFGVVFPSFCRRDSLPAVASVFTTELSAIVLALRTIFTLPVTFLLFIVILVAYFLR